MIKNLEYMAYGKPVVSYDLKEGRRTLGSGALYARPNDPCDFGDKIETLLSLNLCARRSVNPAGNESKKD